MSELAVYVPARMPRAATIDHILTDTQPWEYGDRVRDIRGGSGIVGEPIFDWWDRQNESREDSDESFVVIDFEGNLYGAENMVTWADRLAHAADRHLAIYPTVARRVVSQDQLVRVGTWDDAAGRVSLDQGHHATALARQWVGVDLAPQLVRS